MNKVDYIKNCVEEAIGRHLRDKEYNDAYAASWDVKCKSMQDRINAIVKNL